VGVIVYLVARERGLLFILLGLLPHGILELPMVFLSAAIGLRLGHQAFSALIGRPTQIKREFKEGLMFYFRWILPLLLVAAIIETFITPLILSFI
jgi:stage II sporulation protein M